jgi:hypothetical protein
MEELTVDDWEELIYERGLLMEIGELDFGQVD